MRERAREGGRKKERESTRDVGRDGGRKRERDRDCSSNKAVSFQSSAQQ